MRFPIHPLIVTVNDFDDDGEIVSTREVECVEAEVSVSASKTLAVSVIPVDAEGNLHHDAARAIVGGSDQQPIAVFMDALLHNVAGLFAAYGVDV